MIFEGTQLYNRIRAVLVRLLSRLIAQVDIFIKRFRTKDIRQPFNLGWLLFAPFCCVIISEHD